MTFAFVENGEITKYPIGLEDLRRKYPNTSFPKSIEGANLTDFGVENVVDLPQPEFNSETQYLTPNQPILVNGVWTKDWSIVNHTEEELALKRERKELDVRIQRNQLLQASDWTVATDTPLTSEVKQAWIEYRQSLRDVPTQTEFPDEVTWPTKPS